MINEIKIDRIAPDELSQIKDEAAWEDVLQTEHEEGRMEGRKTRENEIAISMLQEEVEWH